MPLLQPRFSKGLFLAVVTCFALHARAQRLPQTVHPEHYQLLLTPNLKDATFAGSEKIDVLLDQPLDSITLNAAEIKFQSVTTKIDGKDLKATVTEDEKKQQVTFNFNRTLPAGRLTLEIEYTGILNGRIARLLSFEDCETQLRCDAVRAH